MPWKKGQSGNPGGRFKEKAELDARLLARAHTDAAIGTLVKALHDRRLCVAAAQALLDRGWGKPKETVEQANLHLFGGIDAPPLPETLEQWLQRRRSELDLRLEPPAGEAD